MSILQTHDLNGRQWALSGGRETLSVVGLHVMYAERDGWCVALDSANLNCGIHETRSSVRRRFLMNSPCCKAIRADYSDPIAVGDGHKSAA